MQYCILRSSLATSSAPEEPLFTDSMIGYESCLRSEYGVLGSPCPCSSRTFVLDYNKNAIPSKANPALTPTPTEVANATPVDEDEEAAALAEDPRELADAVEVAGDP